MTAKRAHDTDKLSAAKGCVTSCTTVTMCTTVEQLFEAREESSGREAAERRSGPQELQSARMFMKKNNLI